VVKTVPHEWAGSWASESIVSLNPLNIPVIFVGYSSITGMVEG
jgi:hypothetical protein